LPPSPPVQWIAACDSATPPATLGGVSGPLSAAQRDSLLREVEIHRAAWQARRVTDYRIRVAFACFCPGSPPAILEVRGGVPVALRDTAGRPVGPAHEPWSFYTVEGLFDAVATAARRDDVVEVRFDACFAYPAFIRGDANAGQVDDWYFVTATLLTPRP
jgi:hypothetical protein